MLAILLLIPGLDLLRILKYSKKLVYRNLEERQKELLKVETVKERLMFTAHRLLFAMIIVFSVSHVFLQLLLLVVLYIGFLTCEVYLLKKS